MCKETVNTCLSLLRFVPDWFATNMMLKDLDNAVFFNDDIAFVNANFNKKRYVLWQSRWLAPPKLHFENFNIFEGLYITQLNIYDGDFIAKIISSWVYSQKSYTIDARLGSKYDTVFTWDV